MKPSGPFDGRVLLTESEWRTYMRRMPVRFIRKQHSPVCHHCGQPGTPSNPLQHSHRIGFNVGIKQFGLTPDFLDSSDNIVSAHRTTCNKAVELLPSEVLSLLAGFGVVDIPEYLKHT